MQSNNDSIQNVYNFCTNNNFNIKDFNLHYSDLLEVLNKVIFEEFKLNHSIENYDKNILINITYENMVIKKLRTKLANYKGLSRHEENVHIDFLDKLLKSLIKSYFTYKYNSIVYERILMEMIYLIFMNKANDNKTTLFNDEIIGFLIDRNEMVKNIFLYGIDSSYKDISSLSISFVKKYKHIVFEDSINSLTEIIKNRNIDLTTKERLIQIFIKSEDFDHFQEYYIQKIEKLIDNMDNEDNEITLKTINDDLKLLKNFTSSNEVNVEKLFVLVQKTIDSIKLYITGDPNVDLTNEYKIIISYKIYSNIIEIVNKNLKIVNIDYIHELLLTLSNSACIHITVPLYKTLLKSLNDANDEQKLKYFNSLNNALEKYHHFGRRFGALPYMYQQIFSTFKPTTLDHLMYENFEHTALNFEIKLAILPYLKNFKSELQWVFNYKPQNDYVMDTYIVRLITGIINFTLTKLKAKNYKVFRECLELIVNWINSNDSYDKMLLGVLAQLVKNKNFVTKMNIDWEKISHNKNWLIRKSAAELYYICNSRNFDLNAYITDVVKNLKSDDNSIQYHLFVIDCYCSNKSTKNIDIESLALFYDENILSCKNNKYLHLQVLKNINNCDVLKLHYYNKENIYSNADVINEKNCGVNEMIVKELLDIYATKLLLKILKSKDYYEIAVDFLLKTSLKIEFKNLIPDLCRLYASEKYAFIKLKIVKIFEKHADFESSYIEAFCLMDKDVKNHDLKQEFEILNLNDYWQFFSDEDETKRLISLKKAIVSKNYLKMYQFENDNDSPLITSLYKSLNLPSLSTIADTLKHENVKKELIEILKIVFNELKDEHVGKKEVFDSSSTLFEVDNFHNISTLWWYVYLLTYNQNHLKIPLTTEDINLLKAAEIKSMSSKKIDVRLLIISRISNYQDFTPTYKSIIEQL
ncbi:hypothetical protein DAHU10_020890 [Hanseniaspora uvarum]|nr:hypothetical protein DAHU10_020890 [Hanseniaspora uvarum]